MGMHAGGKPIVGRLQTGSAPCWFASSTSAARARSRGDSSKRLDVRDRAGKAPAVRSERGRRQAPYRSAGSLSPRATSAASRNRKLGSCSGAVEQAADAMRHGEGAGEAADVSVGHQAGRHHGVEHRLGLVGRK